MTTVRTASLALADRHGRVATDLRVSLTDRCNLRCTYCMPAEGLPWLPRSELLDDAEISRLIRIAVEMLGVREVRFTGGEPLLRPGLEQIIAAAGRLDPRPELSMTTNGIGLARRAAALADSGLTRINVSLDTLQPDRFRQLARRDRLADVLAGLDAAARAGLRPVKVNAVLMRGINDDEAPQLLRFCLDHGFDLRFIEQMPLDADHTWRRDNMITAAEILSQPRRAVHVDPSRRTSRQCAGRALAGRRRAGDGRRDRLGDQAVLLRLRPHPPHRRRPDPQLPVQHR